MRGNRRLADIERQAAKHFNDVADSDTSCASDRDSTIYILLQIVLADAPNPTFDEQIGTMRTLHELRAESNADTETAYLYFKAEVVVRAQLEGTCLVTGFSPRSSDAIFAKNIAAAKHRYVLLLRSGRLSAPGNEIDMRKAPPCRPNQNRSARAFNDIKPDYPDAARQSDATASTQVQLSLNEHGIPIAASIYKSSGNGDLDNAAIDAAKMSTYTSECKNGRGVPTQLIIQSDFDRQ